MRFHRFIGNFNFSNKSLKILDEDLVNQFRKVLRFKPRDRVILGNGKMEEVVAEIDGINDEFVSVKILEFGVNKNESQNHAILYCSILKRENFELAAQKATEVGVKEIVPVICKNTVKLDIRRDRLEKIIKEAAEQSGRGIVPILHKALTFGNALENAAANDINLFFDSSGGETRKIFPFCHPERSTNGAKDLIRNEREDDEILRFTQNDTKYRSRIGIFIGPEGGWDEKETELARNTKNFKIVSLGKLTLRAETAAVIGSHFAINF